MTLLEIKRQLRNGPFAWPGGYPLFFTTRDCAALCFDCTRKEWRQVVWDVLRNASTGWRVDACDVNWEDSDLTCAHCNKRIESAYGMNGGTE